MSNGGTPESDAGATHTCECCGTVLETGLAAGLCRKCLFKQALSAETPEASADDLRGHFGDYTLGRQIGRGGMGVVYEAAQHSLSRTVAIKMILDAQNFSAAARQRFQFEAETIAKLDHPGIVPVYEVGEHGDQPYLVMKLVSGESLRDCLAAGRLCMPPPALLSRTAARQRASEIAHFISLVAQAVHHAHERDVLHRDLKPANILVDKNGQPHLTDFGLAKLLGDGESQAGSLISDPTRIMGTPAYMSPEQAETRRLTRASDVYSLGAILYEMLTRRVPFSGSSIVETLRMLLDEDPRPPRAINPFIDADLERICLKCLEKEPATRYATALGLAQDLECWIRREPVRARPISPIARASRWVKRNPVASGLIVTLSAFLVVALVLLHNSRENRIQAIERIKYVETHVNEMDQLWDRNPYVEVSSDYIATLLKKPVHRITPNALRLDLAVTIRNNPGQQATDFAPFIRYLEEQLQARLKRTVLVNLRLYNIRSWANPAVAEGEAEIQFISPVAAVRMLDKGIPIHLLFRGQGRSQAVIFAREGAGILTLADLWRARMAFAHTNSMLSCLAKMILSTNGICATNLASCVNFDREVSRFLGFGDGIPTVDSTYAHEIVMRRVLAGEYNAGVAPREAFEDNKPKGLVELHSFTAPNEWFVASPKLPIEVVDALKDTALKMSVKDRTRMLGPWKRWMIGGVRGISAADIAEIRSALQAQERCFGDVQQHDTR